ncbi:MAG: phospholipid scramblase family protein [Bacteroidales bacterium]|jgi:uncharacterized protein YxjI|nr:phospholipid scramblase family protein [Bacteroidales bacterium]
MNFFDTNSYFIDEKVNFFNFENCYKVFNDNGDEIGSVRQKLTSGQKLLRVILNKAMLPFKLEIRDIDNKLQATISRGWTFFMSEITIDDADGNRIGTIKQKFKFLKPTFKIFDTAQNLIGVITGDWKAWNFTIKGANDNQIGTIDKKWAGAMKELFTTADKYNVTINPEYTKDKAKIAIISSAITIDMVLKESK